MNCILRQNDWASDAGRRTGQDGGGSVLLFCAIPSNFRPTSDGKPPKTRQISQVGRQGRKRTDGLFDLWTVGRTDLWVRPRRPVLSSNEMGQNVTSCYFNKKMASIPVRG
jgi:hypothetical protein